MIYCQSQVLIIDYSLDMFRVSLCPSSGEKTTCYCMWSVFYVTREDADISRVAFMRIVCGLISWGYWCVCVCVAVSSWVCRSIVIRFVRLVRSSALGPAPRFMYQFVWGFLLAGALGGLLLLLKGGLE